MPEKLSPAVGLTVLHLFFRVDPNLPVDSAAVSVAVKACQADDHQVVSFAILGHKADVGFMSLGADMWRLRKLQSDLVRAGLVLVDSYVSMTEASEYTAGMPEEMLNARLYPTLPPNGMRAICFYPMSKRRGLGEEENWFTLPFDDRNKLMREHGTSGRKFHGRVTQMVTGSTGLDDFEWSVTLFAHDPADLKATVYTMRFDEASAVYAEFGRFLTGMIAEIDELAAELF
jgi:hydrogen peroxide-dependent heme synthase